MIDIAGQQARKIDGSRERRCIVPEILTAVQEGIQPEKVLMLTTKANSSPSITETSWLW